MDKRAAIRRVRIAVSVFFGGLALTLCMLWVRSHSHLDYLQCQVTDALFLSAISRGGIARLEVFTPPFDLEPGTTISPWDFGSRPLLESTLQDSQRWFSAHGSPESWTLVLPLWIAVAVAGLLSAIAWSARANFSLRTMLIATSLVAILLGLGVWLTR